MRASAGWAPATHGAGGRGVDVAGDPCGRGGGSAPAARGTGRSNIGTPFASSRTRLISRFHLRIPS